MTSSPIQTSQLLSLSKSTPLLPDRSRSPADLVTSVPAIIILKGDLSCKGFPIPELLLWNVRGPIDVLLRQGLVHILVLQLVNGLDCVLHLLAFFDHAQV